MHTFSGKITPNGVLYTLLAHIMLHTTMNCAGIICGSLDTRQFWKLSVSYIYAELG